MTAVHNSPTSSSAAAPTPAAFDQLRESYEALPYRSQPIAVSHPESLAVVATLFGMSPPPVRDCRVLELGCANGGNLIPMALSLPHATLRGVDLSPAQVESARAAVRTLGLKNVTIDAMSLSDIGDDFGTYDYIVCHGVYSWVPADVQDAILRVCSRNLAPNGVAYVSYNTYPGWRVREMVRDMLMFHDAPGLPAKERVARGRAFLGFLARSAPKAQSLYGHLLEEELQTLATGDDSYFVHEELEVFNAPVYFADFMRRAEGHGLRFLSEARVANRGAGLASEVLSQLDEWTTDPIQIEQYLDFLHNRTFRRTLLCHADQNSIREPAPDRMRLLHLSARAEPIGATIDEGREAEIFRTPEDIKLTTNHPLVRSALHILFELRPRPVAFDDLWQHVKQHLQQVSSEHAEILAVGPDALAEPLLQCALSRFVDLGVSPASFATEVSERPEASALARRQAAAGELVTSLRHFSVELPYFDRFVLRLLDGTRDWLTLVAEISRAHRDGELAFKDWTPPRPEEIPAAVSASLRRLRNVALLVA